MCNEEYIIEYSENEMKKLKKLVNDILKLIGGIDEYQLDDFYSLANEELWKAAMSFDPDKCNSFHAFYKGNVTRKIKTYLRDLHAKRRCNKYIVIDENGDESMHYEKDVRLDNFVDEDQEVRLIDLIGDNNVIVVEDRGYSTESLEYIRSLTNVQRQILFLLADGKSPKLIKEKLHLSSNKYNELTHNMRSFNKTVKIRKLIRS